MKLIVTADYEALSRLAAERVASLVRQKPGATLVFPTGNTPLGMFRDLVQRASDGEVSFRSVRLIELDDYLGIALDDPRSLYRWLDEIFITPVGISTENILRFDSAADPDDEITRIEAELDNRFSAGIDLQVLGLGTNGHIAFNEPGSPFDARVQVVELAPESLVSNARYFDGEVPRHGITLGLGTLARAQETLLLVSGSAKAAILTQVLASPVTPDLPATWLKTLDNVTVIADQAAAGELDER